MPQWDYLGSLTIEPVSYVEASQQAVLDFAESPDVLNGFISAARLYAENATNLTLLSRQIRLTVYDTDPACKMLALPRGPVSSIDLVTDQRKWALDPSTYELRRCGTTDYLYWRVMPTFWPPTVIYMAGFGQRAADVPADIRHGILLHVTHLWENRSASTVQPQQHVLAGLDAIYGQRRAGGMIG